VAHLLVVLFLDDTRHDRIALVARECGKGAMHDHRRDVEAGKLLDAFERLVVQRAARHSEAAAGSRLDIAAAMEVCEFVPRDPVQPCQRLGAVGIKTIDPMQSRGKDLC
jgi:hypothetical protein